MKPNLVSVLQKSGMLSSDQITAIQKRSDEARGPLKEEVLREIGVTEETVAEAFSKHFRVPYVRLAAAAIDPEAVKLLSEDQARKFMCVPISKEEVVSQSSPAVKRKPRLVVAMYDPSDLNATQGVEFATGCIVKPVVATQSEIEDAISHVYAPEDWLADFLKNVDEKGDLEVFGTDENLADLAKFDLEKKESPAVKMANLLIRNAISLKASDIHIEPALNHVQVRNRVEGMLREYMQMPKWIQEPLVSRIKILARLDISERRVPQDGRIKVSFESRDVDLRVSTLPTHFGEKVVIRVLGSGQKVPATTALGFAPKELEMLKNAAGQPQGMILVTGPTGSGKTTTLYSILEERKRPDINIITVEDPIEFQLSGINQVQVNTKAGLTFASSLRSILRQDPDVILVGEIRDLETAEIAFHAAMTGHLVFSTIHTNSTSATIGRLLDLGVDPQLITPSIILIVAQRLLRKLCAECKVICPPDPKLLRRLQLEGTPFDFYGPKGCDACNNSGYSSRVGVYELLRFTPAIKELVARKATEPELQATAVSEGMVPLIDSAIQLIREGVTSIDEVARVIQLSEETLVRCPKCSTVMAGDADSCPTCARAVKLLCESCEQELKPEWRVCPYCSAQVGKPAATAQPQPAPRAVPAPVMPDPEAPRQNPRILVVDDDTVMRTIIVQALSLLPQEPEVLQASSGEEGLRIAADSPPDVVLLDVKMPGMNGIEVCRRLRTNIQTAFVPVMMLTASTDEETRSRGFLVGTDDFMAKPISVPELHSRVNRLLRRTYGM